MKKNTPKTSTRRRQQQPPAGLALAMPLPNEDPGDVAHRIERHLFDCAGIARIIARAALDADDRHEDP